MVEGVPGAGKTLYALEQIVAALRAGKHVWTNVRLKSHWPAVVVRYGWRSKLWSAERLYEEAWRVRDRVHYISSADQLPQTVGAEGSRLMVFDEAQLEFNCRESKDRGKAFLLWFSQHRKFGFDVLLIAQDYKMVDRQVRTLAEQVVTSYNLARWTVSFLFLFTVPVGPLVRALVGPLFLRRARYADGLPNAVLWREMSTVPRTVATLYDTTQVYGVGNLARVEKHGDDYSRRNGGVSLDAPVTVGWRAWSNDEDEATRTPVQPPYTVLPVSGDDFGYPPEVVSRETGGREASESRERLAAPLEIDTAEQLRKTEGGRRLVDLLRERARQPAAMRA